MWKHSKISIKRPIIKTKGCVFLALHLFTLSASFEDAIRIAISYGGDSDTLGAIVGSLAGAFYEIPKEIEEKALSYLPKEMLDVITMFNKKFNQVYYG